MSSTMITFGTYEGGVVGFNATVEADLSVSLEQIMSTSCHIGCVRSAAATGRFAVTGGTDELINVFDTVRRTHLGTMGGSVHTSTITALAVAEAPGLLISGCEDGQIAITKIKDSQTLKSFQGHKSAIMDISAHPSGKMALSISTDNTLRMWDLTRGTCAALRTVCPIKRPNTGRGIVSIATMMIRYTPAGFRYALLLPGGKVEICSSTSMETAEIDGGFNCVCALTEDFFLAGDSKGTVSVLKTTGSTIEKVSELSDLHAARLRGIARVASTSTEAAFAASVCAGGRIVFSKLDLASGTLEEVRSVETGMRVTCFTSNC